MNCTIIRREEQHTSVWSGGKTTQLFLHPPKASYANRDFSVRISTASVDDDSSVFTALPGFHRLLMPLDAAMRLVYEGQGEASMAPFQAEEFDGGWNTTSYGKCTDFGIMLAPGWKGTLQAAGRGEYLCRPDFTGVYALADQLSVKVFSGKETLAATLTRGDFLLLELPDGEATLTLETDLPNAAVIACAGRE